MPVLEAISISKTFPGVRALSGVSFDVEEGECHALLGENGAGKSTLIKILTGIHRPDEGKILLRGEEVTLDRAAKAFDLGISVIHQELNLLRDMNVAANIMMGNIPMLGRSKTWVDWPETHRRAQKCLDMINSDISPKKNVRELTISQAQLVEIAKALSRNGRIVFMDEPTSSLSPNEQENLFSVIRNLKASGISIVYISHRIEEIMQVCDRATVLRDGEKMATVNISDTNSDELVSMMVGRSLKDRYPKLGGIERGRPMLQVRGLCRENVLRDINFEACSGEILGITGLVGARRTELLRAIFGADRFDSGEILVEGKPVRIRNVQDAISQGMALLNEDRKNQGLLLDMSVNDNISVTGINCKKVSGEYLAGPIVKKSALVKNSQKYVDMLKIKTPSLRQIVKNLSGGNQQKVILAKWLSTRAKIVMVDEPTRGIDVGSKAEIYMLLEELARNGAAVIMVSSELPEVIGVSDRILVMRSGEIVAELDPKETNEEEIIKYFVTEVKHEKSIKS